ncbi:NAD-dependent epimerase/dehydratase family protein [Rubritalea spongiae]|uniref:NAD-dependent epimerase/dehydratase family protein n=1 Tax=Rubritalea spongiae TaxID=430797 RepID=A0ABW5E3U0_9BACT
MANILIVGGTGCVGIETTQALLQQGTHKIICLSRGQTTHAENQHITYQKGDILDLDSLSLALETHAITHVLHVAALRTSDCKAQPHLAVKINVNGTANLLEAIRQYGKVQRLVFLSTAAVYTVSDDESFVSENSPTTPLNAYTATKLAGEQLVECYSTNYQIPSTILRPQIIYGLSRGSEGSTAGVSTAITKAFHNEPFTIPFGGTTGFHYAPDIGQNTTLALISSPQHFACYNLPVESLSLSEITQNINREFQNESISHDSTIYPFPTGLIYDAFKKDFPDYSLTPFTTALTQMHQQLAQ